MNKLKIFYLALVGVALTSCDMANRDSHYDMTYNVDNLIVDTENFDQPAVVSESKYKFYHNLSKNSVDITASDVIIDNRKISFETDTMAPVSKTFSENVAYLGFSRKGNVGKGASVSDLSGYIPYLYRVASTNLFNSNYKFEYNLEQSLILNYMLDGKYRISTFQSFSTYVGSSYVTDSGSSFSTKNTGYVVDIDFTKKTALVYVLGMELTADPKSTDAKVMLLQDVPVIFTHEGFRLEASAPKTTIPGTVDNKSAFVESPDYKVSDFSMALVYPELTDTEINYKVAGKNVHFNGCSILKSVN
ncbi:MAG: hypothetical protein K2K45_06330 [Muribaculaceae bacterium]|nr:hypothetical protein [Muribaculaceae bacterium]